MWYKKMDHMKVRTPIGIKDTDSGGSVISGVRMDTELAYSEIPELLQKVINDSDEEAWRKINDKIDYIYGNLDYVLSVLEQETSLRDRLRSELQAGKKLLFKPNLVNPTAIDGITHGEDKGAVICTEWPFIAALMRCFHDRFDIGYHQMALGDGATSTFIIAEMYSQHEGNPITTEALIEGKSGDFYGGWGFYFVRKYLADRQPRDHGDDPMQGFEESVNGVYIPPGKAADKLMVYDLNKIQDAEMRGRSVEVPEGVNFPEIMLHKAIVGGDRADQKDREEYPGCVLVNVPKLKMHAQDLITNAIKNLGIGLYPTQVYDFPNTKFPSLKGSLPHSPWVYVLDEKTHFPLRDDNGDYIRVKTGGFNGTETDVIKAVQNEDTFMIHVTDTLNMINISHNADGRSVKVPEGYAFASLDCVALDLFCARYCFKTLPMARGLRLKQENGWPTEFVHTVPVAKAAGRNISSGAGLDSPLFRYSLYDFAQMRGIGNEEYHVIGWDTLTDSPLVSVMGHLGRVSHNNFTEMMTDTLYYNPNTIIHDLQFTVFSYLNALDTLFGSSLLRDYLEMFDENGDGIIDYAEMGKGFETVSLAIQSDTIDIVPAESYGALKKGFLEPSYNAKNSNAEWNAQGHDFLKEGVYISRASTAFNLSQNDTVAEDLFVPGMYYGKGMWPSWQTTNYVQMTNLLYGAQSLSDIDLNSLYGNAFQYADKVQNEGRFTESTAQVIDDPGSFQYGDKFEAPLEVESSVADAIRTYFAALKEGMPPLRFTVHVPEGYGKLQGEPVPNVKETDAPGKLFTAEFTEVWCCNPRMGRD